MQTGQVSVWIPIAVGIIGVIGIVVGQLINAWREDRRWKRDQQREELRWEQERRTELFKLEYNGVVDWRSRRLGFYADYLTALSELKEILYRELILRSYRFRPPYFDSIKEFFVVFNKRRHGVMLVASDPVLGIVQTDKWLNKLESSIIWVEPLDGSDYRLKDSLEDALSGVKPDDMSLRAMKIMRMIDGLYDQVLELTRTELGVNPTSYKS